MAMAILTAAVPGAAAQKPALVPPEEVARAVFRADSVGDWATLLRLAHPDALTRFRGFQTWQLRFLDSRNQPRTDSLNTDSTVSADSTVQARWRGARARQERFMLDSVFQVPDVDSLAHTAPDSVFARWFRAARAMKAGDSAAPQARPVYRVIGSVKASDTLAYVVVERPVEQPLGPMPEMFRDFPRETSQADVMVMRRHGREWRSMLDPVSEPIVLNPTLGSEE